MRTKYRTFILLTLLFSKLQALEITVCDCKNPLPLGLINSKDPEYCKPDNKVNLPTIARYEVYKVKDLDWTTQAYACQKWNRQKTVVGYFPYSFDTYFEQSYEALTSLDCWDMVESHMCGKNRMTQDGDKWILDAPPTGEGYWMIKTTYSVDNCIQFPLTVHKQCQNCPLETPLGNIVTTNNHTFYRKNHFTIVWKIPDEETSPNCSAIKIAGGTGKMWNAEENKFGKIVDEESQTEYFFKNISTYVCNENGYLIDPSAPNTYLKIYPLENTRNDKLPAKPRANTGVVATTTARCLAHALGSNQTLLALPCTADHIPTGTYILTLRSDSLLQVQTPGRTTAKGIKCVAATNNQLTIAPCSRNYYQQWTHTPGGHLVLNNSCLTAWDSDEVILAPCNNNANQNWTFIEPNNRLKPTTFKNTDLSAAFLTVSHHQYLQGKEIERENTLAAELKTTYCELLRTQRFNTIALAYHDGILAARALNLPTCQRIQAAGESLYLQQCDTKQINITAKTTKCGPEPYWNNFTISKNGFSLFPFTECYWSSPHVNLNGKTFNYINGEWHEERYVINFPSKNTTPQFTERIDNENTFAAQTPSTYSTRALEQLDVIGDLMASMEQDNTDTLARIIPAETSKLNLPTFSDIARKLKIAFTCFVLLVCLPYIGYGAITLFRCVWPAITRPIREINWFRFTSSRLGLPKKHIHYRPRVEGEEATWEDGCTVQPLPQD